MTRVKYFLILAFWVFLPSLISNSKGGTAAELYGAETALSQQPVPVPADEKLQSLSERRDIGVFDAHPHNATEEKHVSDILVPPTEHPVTTLHPPANLTSRKNQSDKAADKEVSKGSKRKRGNRKRKGKKRRKGSAATSNSSRGLKKKRKNGLKRKGNRSSPSKGAKSNSNNRKKKRKKRQKNEPLGQSSARGKTRNKGTKQNKRLANGKKKKKRGQGRNGRKNKRANKKKKRKLKRIKGDKVAEGKRSTNGANINSRGKRIRKSREASKSVSKSGTDRQKKKKKKRQKGGKGNNGRKLKERSARQSYDSDDYDDDDGQRMNPQRPGGRKIRQMNSNGGKVGKRYGKKRLKRLQHVKQKGNPQRRRPNPWNEKGHEFESGWHDNVPGGGYHQQMPSGAMPNQEFGVPPHGLLGQPGQSPPGQTRAEAGQQQSSPGMDQGQSDRTNLAGQLGGLPGSGMLAGPVSQTGSEFGPGKDATKSSQFRQRPPRQIELQLKQPVRLTRPDT